MFRHARAAALAAAILCIPTSAAAGGGEWWALDSKSDADGGMTMLIDAASAREVAPGVVELRLLTQLHIPGSPAGWIDARIQVDCAGSRMQATRTTLYDGALNVMQADDDDEWGTMLPGSAPGAFVCRGERASFERRPDFAAPKF